jgi:Phosphotransferase enzyme family
MSAVEPGDPAVQLLGGVANAGLVTRIGDTVRRPAPVNVTTIHGLLRHLDAVGFAAPRPHGVDPEGFELLGFLPGDVAVAPFPSWTNDDRTLVSVGHLVRRYHEAVAGYPTGPDATWSNELADPEGGPIVCHNDVCIENVVFRDGAAEALLDFDFAAPGRPVWDVVHTARYWVPLTDPALAAPTRGRVDPVNRLRLLVDAYGLSDAERRTVPDVMLQAEDVSLRFVTRRVERHDPAFVWDATAERRYEQKMAWLRSHLGTLAAALR